MHRTFNAVLFVFLKFLSQSWAQNVTDFYILDQLLRGYDRRVTPFHHLDKPTEVSCELYIRSFGSINPSTMDYQVDLYLQQSWTDMRLNHTSINRPLDLSDPNLVKAIWKPEIFFPNAKHGEFQYVTVPNVLVRISQNGRILYMLRLKLLFSCMMDLSKYPLDNQLCSMQISSFAKTTEELQLIWKAQDPIKMYEYLKMPQFEFKNITTTLCYDTFLLGNYSCLQADFYLQRSIGFHLVQSYLPTTLVVVVSWVSFWMHVEAVPARVTLGITTLLTVSTKASGIQGSLPQVSYVKAMDVWMGACTAFVFTALLEFTLANYLWRKKPLASSSSSTSSSSAAKKFAANCHENDASLELTLLSTAENNKNNVDAAVDDPDPESKFISMANAQNNKTKSRRIDEMSRMVFPVCYLIFNMCYWSYYLS